MFSSHYRPLVFVSRLVSGLLVRGGASREGLVTRGEDLCSLA